MNLPMLELAAILLLVALNGLLAMSEIAVISARRARLQGRAEEGDAGAAAALELANAPNQFLSTVQIGITLVGILAGAFGGATLAQYLALWIQPLPVVGRYAEVVSVVLVVLAITYLSLVFGELVPKRMALNNAERVAALVAPAMRRLSRLASPLVRLLSGSTNLALRALGAQPSTEPPVTEEEVRILIGQGTQAGIFEPMEEELLTRVFRLADRRAGVLLVPRADIVWLDLNAPPKDTWEKIAASGFSRFPVARGKLDQVAGIVFTKHLLAQQLAGQELDLQAALQPAIFIPEGVPGLRVLEEFREKRVKMALVIDEYGSVQGLVTINDILEAIVGALPEPDEVVQPLAVQREDGSWLLDGSLPVDEVLGLLHLKGLPGQEENHYQTLGGFVMFCLGHVPSVGDLFDCQGWRFEVVDMDDLRVDQVLARPTYEPVDLA